MSQTTPRYPIVLSILAALLTIGMKTVAYLLTDSVSLFSDAVESLVNLIAALTAFVSLWYAAVPADRTHTYGHEKIEFFSSGLEGLLILSASCSIIWYAVERLIAPRALDSLDLGLLIAVLASCVNLGVGIILLREGKRARSIVLEANGHHLLSDVWTTFGVLAGLLLAWLTGWYVLDPILALFVALNILWTGGRLIGRSFHGLMDHALPEADVAAVRKALDARMQPRMHYHALRTRQAGTRRFVEFHLLVPGDWTVQAAHDVVETLEHAVRDVLPGGEVSIHVEPIESPEAWRDSELLKLEPAPPHPPFFEPPT
jgi:cation diffusion facilitator family transporter